MSDPTTLREELEKIASVQWHQCDTFPADWQTDRSVAIWPDVGQPAPPPPLSQKAVDLLEFDEQKAAEIYHRRDELKQKLESRSDDWRSTLENWSA